MGLRTTLTGLALLAATALQAAPRPYVFDFGASEIGFDYSFQGETVHGGFPQFTGDLVVDFDDIRNSSVSVTIDAAAGTGGFVFATAALRGPKMLDTDRHPTIRFQSSSASIDGGQARVEGDLTVRGVTRPARLDVRFVQVEGQPLNARDTLDMIITTRIDRYEFGVSGYPDMVGPFLDIEIRARIERQD